MAQVHHLRSNPSHPLKRKWRSFGNDEICLSLVLLRSRRPNNHSSNIHNSNNNTLHPRTPSTNTQVSSTHNNIITKPHLNSTLIYSPNNTRIRMCMARINSSPNQIGVIPISTATEVYSTQTQCHYRQVMAVHRTTSVPPSLHSTIIPICQGGLRWIPSILGSLDSLWTQPRSPPIPKRYPKRVSRKEGNAMDVPSLLLRNGEEGQTGPGVCVMPVE
jgi:hypothetical protein